MVSRAFFGLAGLLLLGANGASGEVPLSAVRSVDLRLGAPFRRSVAVAAERLSASACASVLGEFLEPSGGRPLANRLDETGQTAGDYVLGLTYHSAAGSRPCSNQRVLAYTTPGSHVVFVCPAAFARTAAAEPGQAANILIHEALHSLGLADDKPSSLEITRAIERRCGR